MTCVPADMPRCPWGNCQTNSDHTRNTSRTKMCMTRGNVAVAVSSHSYAFPHNYFWIDRSGFAMNKASPSKQFPSFPSCKPSHIPGANYFTRSIPNRRNERREYVDMVLALYGTRLTSSFAFVQVCRRLLRILRRLLPKRNAKPKRTNTVERNVMSYIFCAPQPLV